MSTTDGSRRTLALGRVVRSRSTRFTAAALAVGLTAGAVVTAGGGTAVAATPILAQSVGRFVDGSVGGMDVESLVNLKDATAQAAPNSSSRNPLDARLFNQADIPIGDGLKLPGGGVFSLGAANQLAVAKTDGYSYGAAGAVDNTGGAQLTDKSGAFPSDGTVDLSGAALGAVPIPAVPGLPGSTALPATSTIGGVTAKIGAVQALAQTDVGGQIQSPQSSLADLQLTLGSLALGKLVTQLKSALGVDLLTQLGSVTGAPTTLPSGCDLTATDPPNVSIAGGAVVIDVANATITIDVARLVKKATGQDISNLNTSNFDLIKFLVQNLPTFLSKGLSKIVTSITGQLTTQFTACAGAIDPTGVLPALTKALTTLQNTLIKGVRTVARPLINASTGPLAMLADQLTGVVDIGLNVQSGPQHQPRDTDFRYTSQLKASPDQSTTPVQGQSMVRAIEIDLLKAASSTSGTTTVSLALANAAAGPSTKAPAPAVASTTPAAVAPNVIPTGVPAGAAGHEGGGSPLLPITLLLLGLIVAGGGVASFRVRGKFGR